MRAHSDRGGVHHESHRRRDDQWLGPVEDATVRLGIGGDETGQGGGRSAVATGDVHASCPGAGNLDRDGVSGAAAADHEDLETSEVDHVSGRFEKSETVGVVAEPPGVGSHDAVDGVRDVSGLSETVEQRYDGLFVWDGAVETSPSHRSRTGDSGTEAVLGDLAVHIAPIELLVGERRLHHRHGRVCCGARAERSHDR